MQDFITIQNLFEYIKTDLDATQDIAKTKLWLLFACNTSGKTQLSESFKEEDGDLEETVSPQFLRYNAFFEDFFHWDNTNLVLRLDKKSWVSRFIQYEGIEKQIHDNFRNFTNSKINPEFKFDEGAIVFEYCPGGDNAVSQIKISRAEERLFIWCVFYTILEKAIEFLTEKEEDRSTPFFNNLRYIIIDDPVSSMDDTRIITMALDLIHLIEKMDTLSTKLRVLITTHHCLFYNIIHGGNLNSISKKRYVLSRHENNQLSLVEQPKDSPFAYHVSQLKEIEAAIANDCVQKYHCNFFRAILEKTANFLGYSGGWAKLLTENENKAKVKKLLDHYSHGNLAEIENPFLQLEEKEIFVSAFNDFITTFHWGYNNG